MGRRGILMCYVENGSCMNRHTSLPIVGILIAVVAVCVLVLVAFASGVVLGSRWNGSLGKVPASGLSGSGLEPLSGTSSTPSLSSQSPAQPTRMAGDNAGPLDGKLFNQAWDLLEKQFYGELPEGAEVTYDAIRGVVDRLNDPHTAFVDPNEAALLNADMEGHFEGIGARVDLAENGGVEVKYLFANQPAEKAGVQVGDVIAAVDGKDVTKLGLTEAISLIRGPRGTTVRLQVKRGAQDNLVIPVVRDRIEIPVVEVSWLADGRIARISLGEFSSVAPERLAEAIKAALARKPVGVILDLRGNPGGLLDAAVRIGSYFVKEGPIVIERSKNGSEHIYDRQGRYLLGDTPLVVLVDAGSASASEIVAGAIQDAGSGKLIGERTFGKGSVQLPNMLSDGSQLRVTIAHWFTPKNRAIDGVGLEPDISVPITQEDIAAKRDPQLERAQVYLLQGK
jgi:carboxyl-terminal processing protease